MEEKKGNIWLLRVLCSAGFLGIPVFSSPDFDFSFAFIHLRPFQRDFLSYVFLLLFFYANMLFFLPQLYFRKKYFLFGLTLLISFIITTFLPLWLLPRKIPGPGMPVLPCGHSAWKRGPEMAVAHIAGQYFFQFLVVAVFSFSLRLNAHWKQSEKARIEAELSYLKAQINPHFLFNTLNSIYALAIEKSDHTARAVVQLSDMMRYMISESVRDFVPVSREIDYIRDFIALIMVRLDQQVKVKFIAEGDPGNKQVAPMLLIPFVENAFKYGVNPDEQSDITISIAVTGNQLALLTQNKKVTRKLPHTNNSKLGIQNTRERLQFLYPGKHHLNIQEDEEHFRVFLTIFIA